jgi:hypothetical protein
MNGATWTGGYADLPPVSGSDWVLVGAADFNGDKKPDLVWRNTSNNPSDENAGRTAIWYMNGGKWSGYTDVAPKVEDPNWSIMGVADFDGDGKPDLLWRNPTTGRTTIWYMDGATWTGAYADLPPVTEAGWVLVGAADFNGDGKPDILWRNLTTYRTTIWFMEGGTWTGGFADVFPKLEDPNWELAGIADFDGDGKTDLLWRNTSNDPGNVDAHRTTVWHMNGGVWTGSWADFAKVTEPGWTVVGR